MLKYLNNELGTFIAWEHCRINSAVFKRLTIFVQYCVHLCVAHERIFCLKRVIGSFSPRQFIVRATCWHTIIANANYDIFLIHDNCAHLGRLKIVNKYLVKYKQNISQGPCFFEQRSKPCPWTFRPRWCNLNVCIPSNQVDVLRTKAIKQREDLYYRQCF